DDMTYSVYPMAAWKSFWNGTGFRPTALITDSRRDCFSSVEGVCWSVNYLKAVRYQRGTQILGLCLLLVTTLVLFVLLLLEVIQKRRDSEKIKFSLDMLTHELRTPLTQLNFNIEKMRDQFDVLPDAAQLGLLDMMNQVQKLNLLARNSTHYLSGSKESYFKIQPTEVTDFKIFVEHILDLYLNEISVVWNGEKAHFKIDLFWFGVCLKNLVENALKHGQKPIVVGITSNVDEISIEVQDAGEFKKKSRADDESDQNLGLGLGLVRKILKQMNGELEMKSNPTRAIMRVKKYEE
ncbi:MAG: HAMP domain-containing histidine kinase, partial [Bdellovibrionaceae bacterium]|nr:HAMP domain-containing histidine kinase [Pseudobdellovibrionaceae bacterium]